MCDKNVPVKTLATQRVSICTRKMTYSQMPHRGGRSFEFVASLLELLRKARPTFWEKQRLKSPELRMQLLLQNDQCAFVARPMMTRSLFFVPLKKSGLLRTIRRKTLWVWLLC